MVGSSRSLPGARARLIDQALNPAFDITPAAMVSTLITERGLIKPQHAGRIVD